MKHLKKFESYIRNPYVDKRPRAPKEIAYLKEPVEIRIDVEKVTHASDRQFRHGALENQITDNDIIDTIELAIEELTIALMQDRFDIYQEEEYKKHKDYYDDLANTYGLYLDMPNKKDRRMYVAFCGIQKGYGAFANVDLPKGAFVAEYTGILTNNSANTDYSWTVI